MLVSALGASSAFGYADGSAHAAPPNWQLVDEDDGIKVWKLDIQGSDTPGFRAQMTVDANIEQVLAIVKDVTRHHQWMYQCEESRIIKRFSETHSILYSRINSPWPIRDRDVVLDVAHRYTPQRSAVTFRFRNTSEVSVPLPPRTVRVPRFVGFFRLWQESPTRTHVLYQVEVDAGGSLPSVAARHNAQKLPYETLDALREMLAGKS
jgi:hypothetical protein